jgi:plasmid stability protein
MWNLRVRNVPAQLKEELRRSAIENGRSLSAEVIALIEGELERRRREAEVEHRLRRFCEGGSTDM